MEITNLGHTVIKLLSFFGQKMFLLGHSHRLLKGCLGPASSQLITKGFLKLALTGDQKGTGIQGVNRGWEMPYN